MLHPDEPDIAFIGGASTISSMLTYSLQALWLGELIAGRHRLPEGDAMRGEIEDIKAWKRSWMPFSPARGARLPLHMLHDHDELLRDMGIDPKRKRGWLAPLKELIVPYQPSDYRKVVSGDRKELERKAIEHPAWKAGPETAVRRILDRRSNLSLLYRHCD